MTITGKIEVIMSEALAKKLRLKALGVDDKGYIQNSHYKFNQMVKLDDNYTIVGIKHEKENKR